MAVKRYTISVKSDDRSLEREDYAAVNIVDAFSAYCEKHEFRSKTEEREFSGTLTFTIQMGPLNLTSGLEEQLGRTGEES